MNKFKLILITSIVNVFEWYDYSLFAHFALLISNTFFPKSATNNVLLNVFLIFAIGYCVRPLGGLIFGRISDKYGRKIVIGISVLFLSVPTLMVSITPGYEQIGITASIIIVFARIMQGLAIGGALTGSISYIMEHAGKKYRGLASSILMCGICLGIVLGSFTSTFTKNLLGKEIFYDWGWRIPFALGVVVVFLGIYIKKYAKESPQFTKLEDADKVPDNPISKVMKHHRKDVVISFMINATSSVLFYAQAIYIFNYLKEFRHFDSDIVDSILNYSYLLMACTALFIGWISDKVNKRNLFICILVVTILISNYLITSFAQGDIVHVTISYFMLSMLSGAYTGPEPALHAELYPTNIRNTALAMGYNTAISIFGGSAPYILEYISQSTGSIAKCAYYIIICAIFSLIALLFYKNRFGLQYIKYS